MNEESLGRILGRCLDRIAAGEAAAACLDDYPERAAELSPLLAAATEVGLLRNQKISDAGRQRMRAQILNAEVMRDEQRAMPWARWPVFGTGAPRLATGFLVALLCVLLTTGAVVASQPGDLAYGLRVAMERAPALLPREPQGRARAELGIIERRLGDLDRTSQSPALDERAVGALLNSVDGLTGLAAGLPATERAEIAARVQEQAEHLARLGDVMGSDGSRAALEGAADRMRLAAGRIWPPTSQHGKPPASGPTATVAPTLSATPAATALEPGEARQTRRPVTGPTPLPASTRARSGPAWSATRTEPGPAFTPRSPAGSVTPKPALPTTTPKGRGGSSTPQAPVSSSTPQGPGPNGTAQAPNATRTPQGPGANATPQGPGPDNTQEAPVPAATSWGPGPNSTPEEPRPSATSWGPGPNSTPEGPGASATPQGPGPNSTPRGPGPGATPDAGPGCRSCP